MQTTLQALAFGVGVGIIVLGVLWALTLITLLATAKAKSGIRYVGILLLLIVLVISIVLIVIPKSDISSTVSAYAIMDVMLIGRAALLALFGLLVLVAGGQLFFAQQVIECKPEFVR